MTITSRQDRTSPLTGNRRGLSRGGCKARPAHVHRRKLANDQPAAGVVRLTTVVLETTTFGKSLRKKASQADVFS
jgi:hypothetical protein